MSFELDCIKRTLLGRVNDLPSDSDFLASQKCHTAEEFFNTKWKKPDPCYFIWIASEMSAAIKGERLAQSGNLILMKVSIMQFSCCRLDPTRRFIAGESGFYVRELLENPKINFGD